jgi:hypothetical protein
MDTVMKPTVKDELTPVFKPLKVAMVALAGMVMGPQLAHAQAVSQDATTVINQPSYADLATFSDAADLVIRTQIRRQTVLKPDRAPGLAAGFARLYIEANTVAVIAGRTGIGPTLAYLVDVPLDAKGKVPKLKNREFVLFADAVPGRAGEVRLVAPGAQLAYTPALEARLRPILTELYSADVPPRITGISDALAVAGTLTGESETQVFLATENRAPVSLTILRRPGQQVQWGVSWGEIIDSAARPPAPETVRWYRLACALPAQLPSSANLAREAAERRLAAGDYAYVISQLGPCERRVS